MDINMLIKLITIVLAVSLASERLVTFIKTLIPQLTSKAVDSTAPLPKLIEEREKWRQISIMIIAFLASWLTASYLSGSFDPWGAYNIDPKTEIRNWIIGLLASGGSAFWTSLLGYTKAVKDIKIQNLQQEALRTAALVDSTSI